MAEKETSSNRKLSLSNERDTLEDIIVELYKRKLEFEEKGRKPSKRNSNSPYQQNVAPENMSTFNKKTQRQRPMSAKPSSRRRINSLNVSLPTEFSAQRHSEEKDENEYSSSFASDSSDSEKDVKEEKKIVSKKARTKSAQPQLRMYGEEPPLSPSRDLSLPLYQRQPYTITCNAYKNGLFENPVRLTASSIKELLEAATLKLELNLAARRLFLIDGSEVFRPRDVPKDADVFVSKGEPFKDLPKALKYNELRSESTTVLRCCKNPKRKPKPPGMKRLHELVGKHTQRIIVFLNGDGKESHEVVFNPQHGFSRFLDDCTLRLRLPSSARVVYNWKGIRIKTMKDVEKVDHMFFKTPSIVYGPLWVSKNEGFNPIGAMAYMEDTRSNIHSMLHSAKQCKHDLELIQENKGDMVSNPAVRKLEPEEVDITWEKVSEDIQDFRLLLKSYKEKVEFLEDSINRQESEGNEFVMKHIKKIDSDDRLVGSHGLKFKIFENGVDDRWQEVHINMRDIQRGSQGSNDDRALVKARFLEALTAWHKPLDPSGPARSVIVKKIFDENGNEIKDVLSIQNDDKVWLSYGEEFKPLFVPALTLTLEKVSAVTVATDEGETQKAYKEILDVMTDLPKGSERASQWEVTEGFPSFYDYLPLDEISSGRKHEIEKSLKFQEYSVRDHYVANKLDQTLVLKPKLQIQQKTSKRNLWPKEAQTWLINQNGQIFSRAFSGLALSLDNNRPITVEFKNGDIVEGFAVTVQKKSQGDPSQGWQFTASGHIQTLQQSQQVLMHLNANQIVDIQDPQNQKEQSDPESGFSLTPAQHATGGRREYTNEDLPVSLIVANKFPYKDEKSKCQRWAIKQESLITPNQWKHTKVANPKWKKNAYSWPVLPDGNWNKDYDWPLEGVLLSNVPQPNRKERRSSEEEVLRLKVFQNGEKNKNRFVYLVAPDLSNMQKDQKPKLLKFRRPKAKQDTGQKELEKRQLEKIELNLFLERATSLLDLRFAARRLFDESGKELTSLRGLRRHQVVYVSVGESWVNPRMTKDEQQRRQLLAKLSNDVSMIKAFCMLRNPQDLVLDFRNGVVLGSKLILQNCSLTSKDREVLAKGEIQKSVEDGRNSPENSSVDTYPLAEGLRSAHAQSHLNSDKKLHAKKYLWQQSSVSESEEQEQKLEMGIITSARSSKSEGRGKKQVGSTSQKFIFKDGFISPASNTELVVGVTGLDLDNIGSNVGVELCKKSMDDPVQQWELLEDGFICLKCNHKLVLGVSLPPYKPGSDELVNFEESSITIQHIRQQTYGRAHQKWLWDPVTFFIHAFQSQTNDKEITAANHVSICTHAVSGPEALCQEGFIIEVPGNSPSDPIVVCSSCAKVLRGIHQLNKAPEKWNFACAMGMPRKLGLKQRGSFAFLNGKVDLSTFEAETTLNHWNLQLEKLHQEMSLRLINREIRTSMPTQACRVLARRNGEGRLRQGELVIGTSISGILEQCTQRLSLGAAARRLYTCDGMHILHMDQLIEWATANFIRAQQEESEWRMLENRGQMFEREEPEGNFNSPNLQQGDETNHSTEGTPDHTSNEVKLSEVAMKLRPPSGKRQKESPSDKSDKKRAPEIPLSVILRYPIEVWVSCGENFVPPIVAERLMEESLMGQMKRNADNLLLDTEKHVLRHMQGRRFKQMSPRELKPTRSPDYPILIEGGWQETTKTEAGKLEQVHKLEEKLSEQRPPPPFPKTKGINFARDLYRQPIKKRVMVYQKGDSIRKAAYVWGESVGEILADATVRLGMAKDARSLYNEEGTRITSFDVIERDCLLCVTSGESLKGRPKQSNIRMKANWAQVRKQKGPEATEIKVSPKPQDPTSVGVDPFGPPGLAANPTQPSVAWEIPDGD